MCARHPAARIYGDLLKARQIDDDSAITYRMANLTVSSAPDCDKKLVFARELHRAANVVDGGAYRNYRGTTEDRAVMDAPRRFILRVARKNDSAAEVVLKILNCGCFEHWLVQHLRKPDRAANSARRATADSSASLLRRALPRKDTLQPPGCAGGGIRGNDFAILIGARAGSASRINHLVRALRRRVAMLLNIGDQLTKFRS